MFQELKQEQLKLVVLNSTFNQKGTQQFVRVFERTKKKKHTWRTRSMRVGKNAKLSRIFTLNFHKNILPKRPICAALTFLWYRYLQLVPSSFFKFSKCSNLVRFELFLRSKKNLMTQKYFQLFCSNRKSSGVFLEFISLFSKFCSNMSTATLEFTTLFRNTFFTRVS